MATTPTTPGWLLPCDNQARLLTGPSAHPSAHPSARPPARQHAGPPANPWTRYLRFAQGHLVGGGGFAAAPRRGQVEIGYFTLPGWQQQGHGLAIAAALLAIARAADARLTVIATTMRQQGSAADASPSGRILQRLGFGPAVPARDADAGPVWHWAAEPANTARNSPPAQLPTTTPTHHATPARTRPCPAPP